MFKVFKDGKLPTKGSKYSAAVDLYAREDVVVGAGETVLIPLGVCIDLDSLIGAHIYLNDGRNLPNKEDTMYEVLKANVGDLFLNSHYLQLMLRSSLGKKGLILPNGVGIIDMDYKDEIMMIIHAPIHSITRDLGTLCMCEDNIMDEPLNWSYSIKKGDRVAQIMLCEHKSYLFGIDSTEERVGGFGSTGV
jgi:dUTPase